MIHIDIVINGTYGNIFRQSMGDLLQQWTHCPYRTIQPHSTRRRNWTVIIMEEHKLTKNSSVRRNIQRHLPFRVSPEGRDRNSIRNVDIFNIFCNCNDTVWTQKNLIVYRKKLHTCKVHNLCEFFIKHCSIYPVSDD
jgi:hypothetical protein